MIFNIVITSESGVSLESSVIGSYVYPWYVWPCHSGQIKITPSSLAICAHPEVSYWVLGSFVLPWNRITTGTLPGWASLDCSGIYSYHNESVPSLSKSWVTTWRSILSIASTESKYWYFLAWSASLSPESNGLEYQVAVCL